MKISFEETHIRLDLKGRVYNIGYWILILILIIITLCFLKWVFTTYPIPENATKNMSGWYGYPGMYR